jgi:antitoxin component YwqK of YwqJK toxin-antitoxin module
MKKIFLFLLINTTILTASAQYKYLYYLTKDFASVELKNADFIGKGNPDGSLLKLDCFSKINGALLMSVHFTDSSLSEIQGPFQAFYSNGIIESEGNYENNLEVGSWNKRDTSGNLTDSIIYSGGKRILNYKYNYYKDHKIYLKEINDTLKDIYTEIIYNEDGTKLQEVNFKGNTGVLNEYDSTGKIKSAPLYTKEITEASFVNGVGGFKKFLEQNLDANAPVKYNAPSGAYTVIVRFTVNKDGTLSDFFPETHLGYGMEEEVLRIFRACPNWNPAMRFGRPIKAIRTQPITFVVDNGDNPPKEQKLIMH